MALLGPFNVGYPVAFRSGGDTTREAFGKHIQEIKRIYGILNVLDTDKVSASDLNGMLSGFKPSMSFDDISGSLDLSRTTGNLDGSRISGKIDASKIYGKLSNATIDAGHVNGLNALINSLIPPSSGEGEGITDIKKQENGYALFNNGLIIQWGISPKGSGLIGHANFTKKFPTKCFAVIGSTYLEDGNINGKVYGGSYCACNITQFDTYGFGFHSQAENYPPDWSGYVSYVAFGY